MSWEVWIFALAVLMFAAGTLAGWLLRGQFLGRLLGQREGPAIRHRQEDFTAGIARSDSRADDFAARPGGIAGAIAPAHQDSAQVAGERNPIGDETAISPVRTTFSLALGHRLAESARSGEPLSLLLVRIDNYQVVRDRHGLQATNQILHAAGKFFIASVRGMDWVARFDMTTFAFLLPKTAHSGALHVAERLRTTISSAALSAEETMIPLALSVGTTEAALGDSSEAVLRRAEEAMKASTRAGGNCIHTHARGRPLAEAKLAPQPPERHCFATPVAAASNNR